MSSHDPTQAASSNSGGSDPERNPQQPPQESPWVFWRGVLITLGVALGVRHYVLEARYIPSGSMLPGLQLQDRLLVEKLSLRSRSPKRGEIVVFHAPHHFDPVLSSDRKVGPFSCVLAQLPILNSIPGVADPACDAYIKRVVAVAGDRVVVNPRGQVNINGTWLKEPYVQNYCPVDALGMGQCRTLNAVVPPGHVLVLGDNRANSWDGRFWPGGAFLPEQEIIGRAFWRFWPIPTSGALTSSDPLKDSGAKAGG